MIRTLSGEKVMFSIPRKPRLQVVIDPIILPFSFFSQVSKCQLSSILSNQWEDAVKNPNAIEQV